MSLKFKREKWLKLISHPLFLMFKLPVIVAKWFKFSDASCTGSVMLFAWGVLAPVGIMLALFFKIVWPNGQWFYVSW